MKWIAFLWRPKREIKKTKFSEVINYSHIPSLQNNVMLLKVESLLGTSSPQHFVDVTLYDIYGNVFHDSINVSTTEQGRQKLKLEYQGNSPRNQTVAKINRIFFWLIEESHFSLWCEMFFVLWCERMRIIHFHAL